MQILKKVLKTVTGSKEPVKQKGPIVFEERRQRSVPVSYNRRKAEIQNKQL